MVEAGLEDEDEQLSRRCFFGEEAAEGAPRTGSDAKSESPLGEEAGEALLREPTPNFSLR